MKRFYTSAVKGKSSSLYVKAPSLLIEMKKLESPYAAVLSKFRVATNNQPIDTFPPLKSTKPTKSVRDEFDANAWTLNLFNNLSLPDTQPPESLQYLLKNIPDPTAYIPASQLHSLITTNQLHHLPPHHQRTLFLRLKNEKFKLSASDYESLFKSLSYQFQSPTANPTTLIHTYALTLFDSMKKSGYVPTKTIYEGLFLLLKGNSKFIKVLYTHILNTRKEEKINQKTYTVQLTSNSVCLMLLSVIRSGDSKGSILDFLEGVWYDLKVLGVDLSNDLAVAFLEGIRKTSPTTQSTLTFTMKIHTILLQRRQTSLPWNRAVYDALMQNFGECGSVDVTRKLFDEMREEEFTLCLQNYKPLIQSLSLSSYPPLSIINLSTEMTTKKIPKDDETYKIIINSILNLYEPSLLRRIESEYTEYIHSCMQGKITFPYATPYTYFRLILGYAKLGDLQASLRCLNGWYGVRDKLDGTPPPALFAIAGISRLYGIKLSRVGIMEFFRGNVLEKGMLDKHVGEIVDAHTTEIATKIDNLETLRRKIGNGASTKRTRNQLDNLSGRINALRSRPPVIESGVKGPFGYIYTSFIDGWLQRLDTYYKYTQNDDSPLKIDEGWVSATGSKVVDMTILQGSKGDGVGKLEECVAELEKEEKRIVKEWLDNKNK